MSDKIKPSEVSQVLLDQLKGISDAEKFDEVGTVLTVSDGVARIYGLRNAEANELLEFENGTMAIVMNLEEDNVGCVLLGSTSGIKEGMVVKRTKRIASIRVNDNMLGRVINPLGQAIDGRVISISPRHSRCLWIVRPLVLSTASPLRSLCRLD